MPPLNRSGPCPAPRRDHHGDEPYLYERRLRLSEKVVDAPGIANALKDLYTREGNKGMAKRFEGFDWKREEDAFNDDFMSQGAKMDSQGGPTETLAGYNLLRKAGNNGVQLPIKKVENGKLIGKRFLYGDNRFGTKSGKAKFQPSKQPPILKEVQRQLDKHEFFVTSGRLNEVWQSDYHTSRIPMAKERWPIAPVEINSVDAKKKGIVSGDVVMLYNDYGSVRAVAYVSDSVPEGMLFMAFGFPNSPVNNLVIDFADPATKIPFYKGIAASLKRIGRVADIDPHHDLQIPGLSRAHVHSHFIFAPYT